MLPGLPLTPPYSAASTGGGLVAPNRSLTEVDPRCAPLDYVRDRPRELRADVTMSNNFAFGGINTSLVFGRV